ncbi:MAG: hypothetical protein JWL76_1832 [Thermoleophilia bacterium]|nr:hypothetical protein [Thermoleophilia bacterium]
MLDLHDDRTTTITSLATDAPDAPNREWADTLILELVMGGTRERGAFVGPHGALAARLEAVDRA